MTRPFRIELQVFVLKSIYFYIIVNQLIVLVVDNIILVFHFPCGLGLINEKSVTRLIATLLGFCFPAIAFGGCLTNQELWRYISEFPLFVIQLPAL